MQEGRNRILNIVASFSGRDGEPGNDNEKYILKSMWLMMLSEFESCLKTEVEAYIDKVKLKNISDIHICLLIRNFFGNSEEPLTATKIVSWYKRNPSEINYRNFTQDRVPKYKLKAVEKLFNSLGIFFTPDELATMATLDSAASTRDSIAHGDFLIEVTKRQLEDQLAGLNNVYEMLKGKLF